MDHFVILVNGFLRFIIPAKGSILDIWQGSKYASLFSYMDYELEYITNIPCIPEFIPYVGIYYSPVKNLSF